MPIISIIYLTTLCRTSDDIIYISLPFATVVSLQKLEKYGSCYFYFANKMKQMIITPPTFQIRRQLFCNILYKYNIRGIYQHFSALKGNHMSSKSKEDVLSADFFAISFLCFHCLLNAFKYLQ